MSSPAETKQPSKLSKVVGVVVIATIEIFFAAIVIYPWLAPKQPPEQPAALVKPAVAAPRTLHFKLPIEGTPYHWNFEDREALLAGKLTLNINSGEEREVITVFEAGKLSEDWEGTGTETKKMYFGFRSLRKFTVKNGDGVELAWSVPIDLAGEGPEHRGILRAGEFRSKNALKVYSTDDDVAFLRKSKWHPEVEIEITADTGWMDDPERQSESREENFSDDTVTL